MELLSTFYYQQGNNKISLLLQQYHYRKVNVLFSCICNGRGQMAERAARYMAGQLLQWFRALPLNKICRGKGKELAGIGEGLRKAIRRADRELENSGVAAGRDKVELTGIFCLRDRCLTFRRGTGHICLINKAFGQVHIRPVYEEECVGELFNNNIGEGELFIGNVEIKDKNNYIEEWVLESDIVLLLSSESFWKEVTEEMIKDGLSAEAVGTEEQMDRHLKEIGREAQRRGGENMGAVLLRTL